MQRKERRTEKPLEPESPPDMQQPRADSVDPVDVAINVAAVPVQAEMSISGLGMVASDGEYLPIVKVAPAYPMRALTRGVEGYVIVEYTVTATGSVKDVIVVEAEPTGIFDKASLNAALKFKYKPRIVNGETIEVRGVRNIFYYKLED